MTHLPGLIDDERTRYEWQLWVRGFGEEGQRRLKGTTVFAGDLLVFGSSADGQVIGLDAATGAERWSYFTGAPVRFAPLIDGGDVYVASDDGYLSCLAAKDGALRYQRRSATSDEMILGNGRMVSRRPARGGPVMRDGIV